MDTPQAQGADEHKQAESRVEQRTIEKGGTETMNSSCSENESTTTATVAPPSAPIREHAFDPTKITLKFIFANRDGVYVILDCSVSSTIAEVKGALLSMWPKGEINTCSINCLNQLVTFSFSDREYTSALVQEMPSCTSGEKIRLICMGKGILSPDSKTLESAGVPVFRTHPTPINVAVRPENLDKLSGKKGPPIKSYPGSPVGGESNAVGSRVGGPSPGSTGCSCVVL
jgi:hypothetical protein